MLPLPLRTILHWMHLLLLLPVFLLLLKGLLFLSWLVFMYMDWVAAARFNSTHVPSVFADVKLLLSLAGVGASGGGGARSGQ